jgi:hypothetical protein
MRVLRKTGLHLSLAAKSSFYLPAFDISRSCRNEGKAANYLLMTFLFSLYFSGGFTIGYRKVSGGYIF